MPDSNTFSTVSAELEARTELNKLEARGTLRIALKQAGLEPARVTPSQMRVVLANTLSRELESRGVGDAARLCDALVSVVSRLGPERSAETPESVFERLGGGLS